MVFDNLQYLFLDQNGATREQLHFVDSTKC